jgi:YHS domain-containing protein
MSAPLEDSLIDPVCHAPVPLDSLYRRAHRGALFCFCSARCLDLFSSDPDSWISMATAPLPEQGSTSDSASGDAVASVALRAGADEFPAPGTFPTLDSDQGLAILPPTIRIDDLSAPALIAALAPAPGAGSSTAPFSKVRAGWRNWISSLIPGQERRFARRISRELTRQYWNITASYPELRGRDLYRQIVAARRLIDLEAADSLIKKAESSFASWPVQRELRFRDVVHFIAVSEYLAAHSESSWIHANVGREVALNVPRDL